MPAARFVSGVCTKRCSQLVAPLIPHAQYELRCLLFLRHGQSSRKRFILNPLLAYAVRLVPMHLRTANSATCQTYSRLAFELSPSTAPLPLPDLRQGADTPPRRDRFNVADLADNLEVHTRDCTMARVPGKHGATGAIPTCRNPAGQDENRRDDRCATGLYVNTSLPSAFEAARTAHQRSRVFAVRADDGRRLAHE